MSLSAPVQIRINAEYQSICRPLRPREYESLKQSIKEFGLYEAITINKEGVILDGHHRYKVCKEVGVTPRFKEKEFPDELDEKRYVIETNLERRQLSKIERAELGIKIEELESEKARIRQLSKLKNVGNKLSIGSNEHNEEQGKARDIAAIKSRLSPTTFHRAKAVLERGSPELIQRVRDGKTSITYAYKKIMRRERHSNPPPLPQGIFDVIYADPPWDYYLPLRGDPGLHYQTMPTAEICGMEVPAAEESVLFLWATNPKLEDALRVIRSWGFVYKTNLAWVKDRIGTGYYFRAQHELLLLATRGNVPAPQEATRPPSVLEAPRREHSSKPEAVYGLIEAMYPNRSYLELFARQTREGWMSWGDEA